MVHLHAEVVPVVIGVALHQIVQRIRIHVGFRVVGRHLQRHRVEPRRRNLLARKRRVPVQRIHNRQRPPRRVDSRGKVPANHPIRRHKPPPRRARNLPQRLPARQEKRLVPPVVKFRNHHRPRRRRPKLVPPQLRFTHIKKVPRVQHVVAHKLIQRTAQPVPTALQNHTQHTARIPPVFGRKTGRNHLEFLHTLQRRTHHRPRIPPLRIVHPVNQKARIIGPRAVNRKRPVPVLPLRQHAPAQIRQVRKVPPRQRHLADLVVGGNVPTRPALRVQHRRRIHNRHALRHRAHLQRNVQPQHLVQRQRELRPPVQLKPLPPRLHRIPPRCQIRRRKVAAVPRHHFVRLIRLQVRQPHRHRRHHAASAIRHPPHHRRRWRLAQSSHAKQRQ